MSGEISFSEGGSFDGPNARLLPWNYVEIAAPEMMKRGNGRARIVMALPHGTRPALYTAIGGETLSDPAATVNFIANLDEFAPDPNGPEIPPRYFLGPETDLKPRDEILNDPFVMSRLLAEPWSLAQNRPITDVSGVVVIIDAGIAFWNPRFRGKTGPRFRGMRYLDFGLSNLGQSNLVADADIASFCTLADREGNAAVMAKLGGYFPNSMFGPTANLSPDGIWHGTAIADLAAGAEPGTADDVAIFGLDLPRAVIADYSGSTLTATLAFILPAAIEMTSAFKDKPLTIVMPLGFPGGPQDGTHPAAAEIDKAMAASGRNNVTLVLPAGNDLQNRCHAHLAEPGLASAVYWDLPPEDFSWNIVTMLGASGQPFGVQLTVPGQASAASTTLPPSKYDQVWLNNELIGVIVRYPNTPNGSHTVLALAPTAVTRASNGAPFGRWLLASESELHLWLSRDDRDLVADQGRPHRPSRFWDGAYTRRDAVGALSLVDDAGSAIHRSGTLSALATARHPNVVVVEALERLGAGPLGPAGYSSQSETGYPPLAGAVVDDGFPGRGTMAAANGSARRVRISGTSAAAGLKARSIVMPTVPPGD